jgi:hypothetical protein
MDLHDKRSLWGVYRVLDAETKQWADSLQEGVDPNEVARQIRSWRDGEKGGLKRLWVIADVMQSYAGKQ